MQMSCDVIDHVTALDQSEWHLTPVAPLVVKLLSRQSEYHHKTNDKMAPSIERR